MNLYGSTSWLSRDFTFLPRIALAGLVVGPVGWSGDELGEMLQQGRLPADAVLGTQAPLGQLANGSVEPGPVASITTVRDR
jgi:hypothetical protein